MATDNILRSYSDSSAKEDVVLNALTYITRTDTSLLNMLGRTNAIATVHSYLTDTYKTVASLDVAESGDYTATALTTPSRKTNIVAIKAKNFKVSRTQRDIEHYHGQDELQRQVTKAITEWGDAAEFDILRSTLTSGASGTAPKFQGIIAACSSETTSNAGYTSHNSGTVWNSTILDGLIKRNWDGANDMATDLFMGSFLRNATDAFTQKTNVVVNSPGATTLVKTVSTYQTAFGTVNLHTHKHIFISGTDATGGVLAIKPETIKLAFLKKPYIDTDLARSGDYDNRAVVGKFTIEYRNPDVNWFANGFDID